MFNNVADVLKYELNEKVWFMYDNRIKSCAIHVIEIDGSSSERIVKFTMKLSPTMDVKYKQENVYKTKEALIKALSEKA